MKHTTIRLLAALAALAAVQVLASDGEVAARLDRLFREHKAKIASPGISVSVVDRDGVIFQKGYGVVRAGENTPMTEQTVNAIGSLTKSFTALATMQLEERGLLSVDDPIIKYLPWFRASDKALSDTVTIRMCLNNTTGLVPSWSLLIRNLSREPDALERSVRAMSSYRFARTPGESYEYLNEGWNTVGLIIEKITGRPWERYLAEEILSPLGMHHSSSDRKVLEGWTIGTGHFSGIAPVPAPFIHIQGSLPAGAGFYSTAEDIGRYLRMLLGGGVLDGTRVISKTSIDEMWTPAIPLRVIPYELGGTGEPSYYGMGWFLMELEGLNLVVHGGEMRTMSSLAALDPEHGVAAVVLYNTGMLDPYTNQSAYFVVLSAIRIAEGLGPTSFGIPRQSDPTLNDYSPQPDDAGRLVGAYVTDAGKRLDLEPGGSEGLRGFLADGIYSPDYDVDFVNDTNFVLRNIAERLQGSFVRDRQGRVSSLHIEGETFRRQRPPETRNLHTFASNELGMSFALPAGLSLRWNAGGFSARSDAGGGWTLSGGPTRSSYQRWVESLRADRHDHPPVVMSELRNGYYLQSAMRRGVVDGAAVQTLSLFCEFRGTTYEFELRTPDGELTDAVISILNPFLESLSLQ